MGSSIKFSWLPYQDEIFNKDKASLIVVTKGRRIGFTYGAIMHCIDRAFLHKEQVLWVDYSFGNMKQYYNLYAKPILKDLDEEYYSYNKTDSVLSFKSGGFVNFKSHKEPDGIDGLGYDLVILNEAGIILDGIDGENLWKDHILATMMDNENSRAIIGGKPLGNNFFKTLADEAKVDPDSSFYQISTLQNPLISKKAIDKMAFRCGGLHTDKARQEIFGDFIGKAEQKLFDGDLLHKVIAYTKENYLTEDFHGKIFNESLADGDLIWGLDLALEGTDKSVLCIREGLIVWEFKEYSGYSAKELMEAVSALYFASDKKPKVIFVDSAGLGASIYQLLRDTYNLPVRDANFAHKSTEEGIHNKRAQSYVELKRALPNMQIVYSQDLIADLKMISVDYAVQTSKLKLKSKAEIRKQYHKSTDFSDSLALTFYEKVELQTHINDQEWEGLFSGL